MRIIAGTHGGRLFNSPGGHRTHPMSDKIRGALFNILGDITGQSVLDAFAGTGALGFEALSRGAGSVVAVERDRSAQAVIMENQALLQLQPFQLIRAGVGPWMPNAGQTFDIILLDPPFDHLQYDLLERVVSLLKPGGTVVLSWPSKIELPRFTSISLQAEKVYGDASLYIYR